MSCQFALCFILSVTAFLGSSRQYEDWVHTEGLWTDLACVLFVFIIQPLIKVLWDNMTFVALTLPESHYWSRISAVCRQQAQKTKSGTETIWTIWCETDLTQTWRRHEQILFNADGGAAERESKRVLQVCGGGEERCVERQQRGAIRAHLFSKCQKDLLHSQVSAADNQHE